MGSDRMEYSFHQFMVSSALGGAGLIALDLSDFLNNRGFKSRVWIPGMGAAQQEANRRNLETIRYNLDAASGAGLFRAGVENLRVARVLRRMSPGILHIHSPHVYGSLRRGLRFSGMKRVAHVHLEQDAAGLEWAFRDPPDAIVTCARFLVDPIQKAIPEVHRDRTQIVPILNAVDLERYSPGDRRQAKTVVGAKPDVPLLLMMANLSPHKGQETAIRAVAALKSRGIEVQCWLAGCERDPGGGYEVRLRQFAIEIGVEREVQLVGFRSDGPDLMRAADLLLLPSAREGLPLSILEAQCTKTPILAAPVAGIPEIVEHGKTGFLIPCNNPAGYAEWIEKLLGDRELYGQISERAYDHVRTRHSWNQYLDRVCALYENLLTNSGADKRPAARSPGWIRGLGAPDSRQSTSPGMHAGNGRRLRVAYILSSGSIGGGNRSLQSLWSRLDRTQLEPVAFAPAEGIMAEECRASGIECEVVEFNQPSLQEPLATLRNQRRWKQLFRQHGIDLVHANDPYSARCVAIASGALDLPLVCHVRFELPRGTIGWSFRYLHKPAAFIFNSHAMQAETGSAFRMYCPESQQVVIHNGVNLEEFQPQTKEPRQTLRVAMIANLVPFKGHEDFLHMARELLNRGRNVEFWLAGKEIGDPSYGRKLKDLVGELSLDGHLQFLGFCADVPAILQDVDVLVSASRYEPFGRSVAEAMACATPVVATAVGGVVEVVVDGETGLLVPPLRPLALADGVDRLLLDADLRSRMGRAARERVVREFSATEHARRVTQLYQRLLAGRKTSAETVSHQGS